MDLSSFSSYHGSGWEARKYSMREDIEEGTLWSTYQCNSAWSKLLAVTLYLPSPAIEELEEPNRYLHIRKINYSRLREQHLQVLRFYQSLNIHVHVIDCELVNDLRHPNFLFQRDVFWQTPEGVVISRMASNIRAGEEVYISSVLSSLRIPILLTMHGEGRLEGADCMWVNPKHVLCGVGNRTNNEGYQILKKHLEVQNIRCTSVQIPNYVQHLLGCVQIVSPHRALVRTELVTDSLVNTIKSLHLEVVPVKEHEEIVKNLAFNFVVLDQDCVVMTKGAPEFQRFLEKIGISVAGCVSTSEYVNAAGGLACATGILARKMI